MTRRLCISELPFLITSFCLLGPKYSVAGAVEISTDPFTNPNSQHMTEVEPHIFANGSTIVATFQQGRYYGGGCSDIGFATSTDRGATWHAGSLPGLTIFFGGDDYLSVSDAAVAYDLAHGIWMIVTLPVGGDPKIFVSRSADGLTWDNPVTVAVGDKSSSFDKTWITCDDTPFSSFFGNCYVEWDNVGQGGTVLMSTSSNGGATWSTPLTTPDGAVGLGGVPIVQPSGRVVVPYFSFNGDIRAFISDDGGRSWGETVKIATPARHDVAGDLRAPVTLPSAAIDGDGTLYVAWADCRFREGCRANDIVISTSSDGLTWSDAVRVPIDGVTSPVDHFLPGLGADLNTFAPHVGLALVYYYYPAADCEFDTCQLTAGFIVSRDGLGGWSAPRDQTRRMAIDWLADTYQGRMVGDYMAVVYTDDGVPHPVFASAVAPVEEFFESMFTTCAGCVDSGTGKAAVVPCGDANCISRREPEFEVSRNEPGVVEPSEAAALRIVAPTYRVNIGTSLRLELHDSKGSQIPNATAQWSVEEGISGGRVSDEGVFTAPLDPGVFHVLANNGVQRARVTIEVFTVR